MQTNTISLDETGCFSQSFIDYIQQKKELEPFYKAFPKIDRFKEALETKKFDQTLRSSLADVLSNQYQDITITKAVKENIDKLRDQRTFTITTGHQLNIFTGPLYFIYKIVTVINACKELKKAYPEYEFVPVYWMASEDHDFEEISYFHFEGKKIIWNTNQSGAVGRFQPKELQEIANELPSGASFFKEAYSKETLADAVRCYVNSLFGKEGLVVVDADHNELKSAFSRVIEDDLFAHHAEKLVAKTSASLEELGAKVQVNAREINFFYLQDGVRERIEKTDDGFIVVNTNLRFTDEELRKLIQNHPERFSPNVILRPLYQETVLPNLAYVGGPSELLYWLQLKDVFEHFGIDFPFLMPRNFALVLNKVIRGKWDKTGLSDKDLFLPPEKAIEKWVQLETKHELTYQAEVEELQSIQLSLQSKASNIDPTLIQHIEALMTTFLSKIEKAEKKLIRAEKRKHQEKRDQILAVKEALFPGGTLQERKDNFLNFYLKDPHFIEKLLDELDPFNYEMYLINE